jgi:hypothetical protein
VNRNAVDHRQVPPESAAADKLAQGRFRSGLRSNGEERMKLRPFV